MSVNLPEAIQMKHVITFWGLRRLLQGRSCEVLPGNHKASDGGIFGAGLTLGRKAIDDSYFSL
jgi:hypothetical protein